MFSPVPFAERKSSWRAVLDLAGARYPRFCFGGVVGRLLPVFHFHDVTETSLEPYLQYLSKNGYRTVVSAELTAYMLKGTDPGPRSVVLCFDDALRSVWTVVAPLLARYNMRAITYAIPGRVEDAAAPRSVGPDGKTGPLLCTWPELCLLKRGGVVDVQAHTCSHARIFCDPRVIGFVHPDLDYHPHDFPALTLGKKPTFISPDMLGCPLYASRSRMSDAFRFEEDEVVREACLARVAEGGGEAFFQNPDWRRELKALTRGAKENFELVMERDKAIYQELVMSREMLESRFGPCTVRQVCFPWGVCGRVGEVMVRRAGFTTAVSDALFGKRAAVAGANPFRIMRLKHEYIFTLPGNGRLGMSAVRRRMREGA